MAISAPFSSELFCTLVCSWNFISATVNFGVFCGLNCNINLLFYIWSFGLKTCSFSSSWISGFKSSLTPKLLIFLKITFKCRMFLAGCPDGLSHNLVLIIEKQLQTNLSCCCHSSIRRKHVLPVTPGSSAPLCSLQGSSGDIFNEASKYYGFSYQREVCSQKWRLPAALFWLHSVPLSRLRWNPQALPSQQQQAGPDVLVLTLVEERTKLLLIPSLISTSSGAALPCPAWGCSRDRDKSSWPSRDMASSTEAVPSPKLTLSSEMEEIPAADHLRTRDPAAPVFSRESTILSLIPSKQERVSDPGFPPAISRAFQFCQAVLSCGFLSSCFFFFFHSQFLSHPGT